MATGQAISITALGQRLADASRPIDFRPLLKAIRFDLISKTKQNFDSQTSPDGTPWPPLKRPRPGSKGGDLPLLDQGKMRSSITAPGADGNISQDGASGFVWGTNLDYAAIHQTGGTIRPRSAKFLAIPATKEARDKGSPRNWTGQGVRGGKTGRGKFKKGTGELSFIFGKRGGVAKDLNGAVQYYFAREVTIPKREFLGINDQMADDYAELTEDFVADELARRIGG